MIPTAKAIYNDQHGPEAVTYLRLEETKERQAAVKICRTGPLITAGRDKRKAGGSKDSQDRNFDYGRKRQKIVKRQ